MSAHLRAVWAQRIAAGELRMEYVPHSGKQSDRIELLDHNGEMVGSLEWWTATASSFAKGEIKWVEVYPPFLRQGWATKMLQFAREQVSYPIFHSKVLTNDGIQWSQKVAGPGEGVIPERVKYRGPINIREPRRVVYDPMAVRDFGRLEPHEQNAARRAVRAIENGKGELEPKERELEGTYGVKLDADARLLVYPHVDGAWHVYYLGDHRYDEATRRMSAPRTGGTFMDTPVAPDTQTTSLAWPRPVTPSQATPAPADTPNQRRIAALAGSLFWRTHDKGRPFAVEDASSTTFHTNERSEGYSCFENPWHLWTYLYATMMMGSTTNDEIIGFSGRRIGQGNDGEALAEPDMRIVKRMSFEAWERELVRTPMPPSPSFGPLASMWTVVPTKSWKGLARQLAMLEEDDPVSRHIIKTHT